MPARSSMKDVFSRPPGGPGSNPLSIRTTTGNHSSRSCPCVLSRMPQTITVGSSSAVIRATVSRSSRTSSSDRQWCLDRKPNRTKRAVGRTAAAASTSLRLIQKPITRGPSRLARSLSIARRTRAPALKRRHARSSGCRSFMPLSLRASLRPVGVEPPDGARMLVRALVPGSGPAPHDGLVRVRMAVEAGLHPGLSQKWGAAEAAPRMLGAEAPMRIDR